jgi:hypothetical protein
MYTPAIKAPKQIDIDMGDGSLTIQYYRDQVTPASVEQIQSGDINAMAMGLSNILHDWQFGLLHERVTVIERSYYARHMHPMDREGYPHIQRPEWNQHGNSVTIAEPEPATELAIADEASTNSMVYLVLSDAIVQLPTSASAQEVQETLHGGDGGYVAVDDCPGGWVITYAVIPSEAANRTLTIEGDVQITERHRESEPRKVPPSFALLRQMDFGFLTRVLNGILKDLGSDQGKSANSSGGLRPTGRGRVK